MDLHLEVRLQKIIRSSQTTTIIYVTTDFPCTTQHNTKKPPRETDQEKKMDFAPYQDQSPETQRVLSPPPEGRRSFSPTPRRSFSPALPSPRNAPPANANPWAPIDQPTPQTFRQSYFGGQAADVESGGGRERLNEFETSLPIRLDYEACLAYLLLPPAGGALLLVLEHKSDYVR